MRIYTKIGLCTATFAVALGACAEPEAPAEETLQPAPATAGVFGASNNAPPPAEEVFQPDVFAESDGSITLGFRMPQGYYIYRDKISLRSLSDGVEIGDLDLPPGEIVVDDWFGEQQVYFFDMMANASVTRGGQAAIEVEVTWQGCKENELCYLPVSKVIPVELAAQVESAAE